MARVSMWPMWGLPLAVGGPSKKVHTSWPSRFFMLFWKMSFSFQNLMTSFSRARKSSAVETFSIMFVTSVGLLSSEEYGVRSEALWCKSLRDLYLFQGEHHAIAFTHMSIEAATMGFGLESREIRQDFFLNSTLLTPNSQLKELRPRLGRSSFAVPPKLAYDVCPLSCAVTGAPGGA